jgi:hypothetical protein
VLWVHWIKQLYIPTSCERSTSAMPLAVMNSLVALGPNMVPMPRLSLGVNPAMRVGTFHFTLFCSQNTVLMMIAIVSMGSMTTCNQSDTPRE